MKKYNSLQKLLAITLAIFCMTSCTEDIMDEINKDNNHPHDGQAKYIVTDLLTATAFSSVGGDFSLYSAVYIEQETGVHNQMYNAEVRQGEPTSSTTYNNVWGSVYANIRNAKIAIAKCSKGGVEEGNAITLGAAKVMLAYNAAVLTDLFGDVPFAEAGEINPNGTPKFMQPKIDKQQDIYKAIMQLLDESIVLFDGTDAGIFGSMGDADLIYGGSKASWKKAAYGLKARYTMRLLAISTDKNTDLNNVLDYISKSFKSREEEFKYSVYDGGKSINPLFGFSNSRDALGASKSLVDKYIERKDPRGNQYFMNYDFEQATDPNDINSAPNGAPTEQQYVYDISAACYAASAPTQLLSYHEIMFLKAEALCRLNRLPEAQDALKEAVIAAFASVENTINSTINDSGESGEVDLGSDVAASYFDETIKPLFDANPLKETMNQKYFAFAGASGESVETYNDYRRMQALGEKFIELKNPNNLTKFPLRFSYGSDDVLANKAVQAAYGDGQYVYTEKVWWAGGSR